MPLLRRPPYRDAPHNRDRSNLLFQSFFQRVLMGPFWPPFRPAPKFLLEGSMAPGHQTLIERPAIVAKGSLPIVAVLAAALSASAIR